MRAVQGTPTSQGPVGPPCHQDYPGHWFCITHDKGFQHNLAMWSHCDTGEHTITWVCHKHGPEEP